MQTPLNRDIAIIGGGASGTLLAWQLAIRHGVSCTVIDPSTHPGLGLAYATPSHKNLLNVRACGMSADPADATHFVRWLNTAMPGRYTAECFVPRRVYGRYLRHLHAEATPEHLCRKAVACERQAKGFVLTLENGQQVAARQVVLALGHFAPVRLPGLPDSLDGTGRYHHQPWAPGALDGIGSQDPVTLIGTGLTAVDIFLRLREQGHQGPITALSRHAVLPARHAPYTPRATPILQPGTTPPTARAYCHALHAGLKAGTDWRAAIDSLRPVTNALWLALPDGEKHRVRRHLARRWDVVRHRMAPEIADELAAAQEQGTFQLHSGRVSMATPLPNGLRVTAVCAGREWTHDCAHLINCTAPALNYKRSTSPLVQGLMAKGKITSGFADVGMACTPDGTLAPGLFAIGPARLGTLFESIAIPEIRDQARDLADRLATTCKVAA